MERKEYMRMPAHLIPHEFLNEYDLHNKIHIGYIYMEIRKGMYGLPQAGKIANTLLKQCLANHGYCEVKHTPGLWKHDARPVTFTLIDWTGLHYCSISLDWDYSKRILDINMHKYIAEQIIEYAHPKPKKPQHSPFKAPLPTFGKDSQKPIDHHIAPVISKEAKLHILQIVGSLLYYGRVIDNTIFKALNTISSQQNNATETTESAVHQLMDYCASHPDATIHFYASNMILQLHSNTSYMNEPQAHSTAGGHFFLGNKI
eukprot:4304293-Ditylum_brightwellii.AAC.1